MTTRDSLDLSFIEADEKRREAIDALRKLPPEVADAFGAMFFRHTDQLDALLHLAKDQRVTNAFTKLADRIKPTAAAFGGVRRLLVTVLPMLIWPTGAPSKAALRERLSRRHKAAGDIRSALKKLEHDESALNLSLPEMMRHGQQLADDGIRDRTTRALVLMHAADRDLEGELIGSGPTISDLLQALADRMERDEPLHHADITQGSMPIPQDGRETRDKLWLERSLESVFREFTGAPQFDCIADIEAVALNINCIGAEQIKTRSAKARTYRKKE